MDIFLEDIKTDHVAVSFMFLSLEPRLNFPPIPNSTVLIFPCNHFAKLIFFPT
ncbi:hypothetical protein L208DRAFT_1389824 [Tricholoma matsutake]|nr:hypothetical protein L208DRAFT_1389824 [Tricholoma matsutake 945]